MNRLPVLRPYYMFAFGCLLAACGSRSELSEQSESNSRDAIDGGVDGSVADTRGNENFCPVGTWGYPIFRRFDASVFALAICSEVDVRLRTLDGPLAGRVFGGSFDGNDDGSITVSFDDPEVRAFEPQLTFRCVLDGAALADEIVEGPSLFQAAGQPLSRTPELPDDFVSCD